MEILKTLASDHRELQKLLRQLDMTTERGAKTREKLFSRFKALLVAHSKSEEAVLYDRIKGENAEVRDLALEAYEEHHVASLLLKELSSLPFDNERWGAKLSVLKESLQHHIEEEEDEMFSKARKAFDRQELQEMGEEFDALKEAHLSGLGLPFRLAAKAARKLAS